ncbi:DNA helicase [Cutibacterium acnes JCM 18916]|nr:DNA helicase [Cutibacterium acnes JCM 18916]
MSKQALKLDGSLKPKAFTFLEKLTTDDTAPGLHIEPVKKCRDSRVRTGRVDQQYRAVLFKLTGEDGNRRYVLEGFYNHDEAYDVAPRVELAINPFNGIPEIKRAEPSIDTPNPTASAPTARKPAAPVQETATPVITADRADMLSLGLDANLVDTALALTSEDAVLNMAASLSGWQEAALVGLASGMTPEQVRQELLESPEELPEPSKKQHGHAASPREPDVELLESLRSPAAAMEFATIEGVDELRRVIEDGDFGAWRVFLHPTQRRFVNGRWNGPFCLGGGAGTGKTVVILHRAVSLARENPGAGSLSRRSQRTSPMSCPRVWSRSTPPYHGRPRWDSQVCTSSVLMPWPTLLSGRPEPMSPKPPKASWEPHAPICPGAPPSGFGAMSSTTPDQRYPSG